jgi:hypothetical protein
LKKSNTFEVPEVYGNNKKAKTPTLNKPAKKSPIGKTSMIIKNGKTNFYKAKYDNQKTNNLFP